MTRERKGSGWFMTGEAILGVVMALMIVCRERVDRYMTWVSGVADPFLCAPVTTYSTLYSSPFYRYYSWYASTTTAFCMDANMMKVYIPMLS
ncbi:hypothetical protein V8E54_000997 [Elaphomyces granulatus]